MANHDGKKVILIHPSDDVDLTVYPLGCLMLASSLEQVGYRPLIFDHNLDKDYRKFLEKELEEGVICVGISSLTGTQIGYGLRISEFIRSIGENIPIVWGGHHPNACPESTAADPRVDIVVRGEGEATFLELVKVLEEGWSLEGVKGITYKVDGKIKNNPDRGPVDLDTLPDISWHLIEIQRKLASTSDRSISIQTGRGCPFACTFCSHKKTSIKKYRMFGADYILNNLVPMIRRYGIKRVNFYEPLFVNNQARLRQLCQGIIDRRLKISWNASARVDTFSRLPENLLELLKASGCQQLTFGFESGSQRILDRIEKRITVEQSIKAAGLCRRYSLLPDSDFMVGFPFETLGDILKTLGLIAKIRKVNPDAIIHLQSYTAFPGSALYEECIQSYGLRKITTLEGWSRLSEWRENRPWARGWKKYFYIILRGSVYASSLGYLLEERKGLWLKRPLHYLTALIYNLLYFIVWNFDDEN